MTETVAISSLPLTLALAQNLTTGAYLVRTELFCVKWLNVFNQKKICRFCVQIIFHLMNIYRKGQVVSLSSTFASFAINKTYHGNIFNYATTITSFIMPDIVTMTIYFPQTLGKNLSINQIIFSRHIFLSNSIMLHWRGRLVCTSEWVVLVQEAQKKSTLLDKAVLRLKSEAFNHFTSSNMCNSTASALYIHTQVLYNNIQTIN